MVMQLRQKSALGVQYLVADNHGVAIAPIWALMGHARLTTDKRIGAVACRKLLGCLQAQMGILGKLQDRQLPYHILNDAMDTEAITHYVSFSHSCDQVAVLIAQTPYLGIDIEDKPVSLAVAQRYFTAPEMAWLLHLPNDWQLQATKLLWVLKEAHIKQQGNGGLAMTLTRGLKNDMLACFGETSLEQLLGLQTSISALPTCYQYQLDADWATGHDILTVQGYYWPGRYCGYVIAEKVT